MSGRIFQNVVLQFKETTDRTIGVMDAEGTVIACSELTAIGAKWSKYIEPIAAAEGECIAIEGKMNEEHDKVDGGSLKDSPIFAKMKEIVDKGSRGNTQNFASGGFTIKITYFQNQKNELDQLEKVDTIKELFGMVFKVGDRRLTVGDYSHDYIGEYSDILQISVDIDYKENTQKEDNAPIAEGVQVTIKEG